MDLKQYLSGISPNERRRFAKRAKTTVEYLAQLSGGHRRASPSLARRLVAASEYEITLAELRPDIWSEVA